MDEQLRELVLGIPVQQALVVVEPINCHPPASPVVEIDTSSSFATDKVFATREELIDWARNVAKELKFSIVIEHSDNGGKNRKKKLVLGCERGGVYKPSNKKPKFEATGTRKCQCPFRLRGNFHASNDWHLSVVSGKHNHHLDKVLDGHVMVGRLDPKGKALVEELTRNLVAPRNIMSTLKEREPDNVMAFKQLYNARHRMKLKKSPVVSGKSKGAKKKKGARIGKSTTREPSHWEHVDQLFPDSQASVSKPSTSSQKGARIGKSIPSQTPEPTIPFLDHMPSFMRPYVEDIINVEGDSYCGYRVVSLDSGKNEEDYELVKLNMIREINSHRPLYEDVFGGKDRLKYVLDALVCGTRRSRRVAPLEKWFTFPDMGHVVATYYGKVVVELTALNSGVSETFFPLRGSPPKDPSSRIMCMGLIPAHFVYVKLTDDCPLPPTSQQWRRYCTEQAAAWEYTFLDRQREWDELYKLETIDRPVKKSKAIVGVGSSADNPVVCTDLD